MINSCQHENTPDHVTPSARELVSVNACGESKMIKECQLTSHSIIHLYLIIFIVQINVVVLLTVKCRTLNPVNIVTSLFRSLWPIPSGDLDSEVPLYLIKEL